MTPADGAFRLLPLACERCGAGITADGDDVVYYCVACRSGYRLGDDEPALRPLEVSFVARPGVQAAVYKPFWRLPARVEILQREAAAGVGGLFGRMFGDEGPAAGGRDFVVPAFHLDLGALVTLTRAYSRADLELSERLGERLTGGCYGVEDARRLAHYALIASEVERPDTLRDLRYRLELGEPSLLGVPFVRRRDRLVDAVFGIAV